MILTSPLLRTLLVALVTTTSLLPVRSSETAQKPKAKQFNHAVVRSQDAAKIIELLNEMRDTGFPKELADKSEAVAVFPLVTKEALFFTVTTQGYGVISTRTVEGWSLPAFYRFAGGGYTGTFADEAQLAVVLLFMTKDAVSWFEKGGVPLTNAKKARAGPLGTITEEQRRELEGVQILAYAYSNGKLNGTALGNSFWQKFGLNPDNNINKPVYGMKGREVLAGKRVETASIPVGIPAFQQALEKYHGGRQ
jgi:lipid-binding SYLF domain-containing protein